MPERELVLESLGCAPQNRELANRIQPAAAALFFELSNARRVRTLLGSGRIAFCIVEIPLRRNRLKAKPCGRLTAALTRPQLRGKAINKKAMRQTMLRIVV